jgi:hypothetical protein
MGDTQTSVAVIETRMTYLDMAPLQMCAHGGCMVVFDATLAAKPARSAGEWHRVTTAISELIRRADQPSPRHLQ